MQLIEPPAPPRIAIFWGREELLGKAIELTLASAENWQLIKILDNHDLQTLAREVDRLQPEIIFLSLENPEEEPPASVQALEEHPNLRVITINPHNNCVEVFSRKVICIREMSDLLSIINDESTTRIGGNSNT